MSPNIVGEWEYSTGDSVSKLKDKSLPFLSHSHKNIFSHYVSLSWNIVLLFLFLAVFLILKFKTRKII